MIVAVGGGSVIDLAKMTALLLAHGGALEDYYPVQSVPGPVVPLIALPTTAGTGSEATPVSVITDPKTEMKVGVASPHLIPRHAICDPLLTVGAPPTVTAHSGIDALSHAVEAYMAAREEPSPELVLGRPQVGKNMLSDALALTAAGHLARNLVRAVEDGSDVEARTGMLYGSLLAGIAFGNSGVSAAHALQFAIGAATHTSHGLGTGLLLPYVMEFNRPVRGAELAELERMFGGEPVDTSTNSAPDRPARLAGRDRRRPGGPARHGRGVGRHQAADRQQPAPARRETRSSASSRPPGTASPRAARGLQAALVGHGELTVVDAGRLPPPPPSLASGEVADRAFEVRGHASDGSVHVAALDHVQQLAVLARHRRRAGPSRAQLGDAEPDLAAHGEVEPLEPRAADGARERVVEAEVGLHDLAPVGVRGQLGEAVDRGVDLAERRGALEHLADDQALDRDRTLNRSRTSSSPRTGTNALRLRSRLSSPSWQRVWIAARTVGRATPNSRVRSASGSGAPGAIAPSRIFSRSETTTASVVEIGVTARPVIRRPPA